MIGNWPCTACIPRTYPGSIAVYVDIGGQRVLFGQDIHGPFMKEWGSDLAQWKQSMKLLALNADILCEGILASILRPIR